MNIHIKKAVIWWLINKQEHPLVTKEDQIIEKLMPIVTHLFPGINYFSLTGFSTVMHKLTIPVLKKKFPEIIDAKAADIAEETIEIEGPFLASKGYEWQDSEEWKMEFEKKLAA